MSAALVGALCDAGVEPSLAHRLAKYAGYLLEATAAVNLTGARSPEALAEHLLDALTLLPYVAAPFVDVGSGGGLPGIPLAVATGFGGTLVEPIRKRATFLASAVQALGLPEVKVVAERAEIAAHSPEHRERYRTATARAVGTATEVLELTLPFLDIGGLALLQRGRADPREAAALDDAALVLGGAVREVVAAGGDRRIIIVEKIDPTGPRFPRRVGIPAKRPLCA